LGGFLSAFHEYPATAGYFFSQSSDKTRQVNEYERSDITSALGTSTMEHSDEYDGTIQSEHSERTHTSGTIYESYECNEYMSI
jgi:hypothetical protein